MDTNGKPLPVEHKHLLATGEGDYPLEVAVAKHQWERATINQEKSLGTLAGWYRNPSSAGSASLRIAHKSGESWKSVQPDFIFVHQNDAGELRPSIVDPHSVHQGDSAPKLEALAEYADEHGDLFDRIIAVGVHQDTALIGLDLKNPKTRRAVYESPADKSSLEKLYADHGAKYTVLTTQS